MNLNNPLIHEAYQQLHRQALNEQSLQDPQNLSNPNALPNIGGEWPVGDTEGAVGDTEGGSDPGWPPMDPSTNSGNWAHTYFDNDDWADWWVANIPNWQWIQFMWDMNSGDCGPSCCMNWMWWLEEQLDADPAWERWPIDGLANLYAMQLPDGTYLIFWTQWWNGVANHGQTFNDFVGTAQCACDDIRSCHSCAVLFPNGSMNPNVQS